MCETLAEIHIDQRDQRVVSRHTQHTGGDVDNAELLAGFVSAPAGDDLIVAVGSHISLRLQNGDGFDHTELRDASFERLIRFILTKRKRRAFHWNNKSAHDFSCCNKIICKIDFG